MSGKWEVVEKRGEVTKKKLGGDLDSGPKISADGGSYSLKASKGEGIAGKPQKRSGEGPVSVGRGKNRNTCANECYLIRRSGRSCSTQERKGGSASDRANSRRPKKNHIIQITIQMETGLGWWSTGEKRSEPVYNQTK